jgi:hypothetical protein
MRYIVLLALATLAAPSPHASQPSGDKPLAIYFIDVEGDRPRCS